VEPVVRELLAFFFMPMPAATPARRAKPSCCGVGDVGHAGVTAHDDDEEDEEDEDEEDEEKYGSGSGRGRLWWPSVVVTAVPGSNVKARLRPLPVF
jgi:hypothetical protein